MYSCSSTGSCAAVCHHSVCMYMNCTLYWPEALHSHVVKQNKTNRLHSVSGAQQSWPVWRCHLLFWMTGRTERTATIWGRWARESVGDRRFCYCSYLTTSSLLRAERDEAMTVQSRKWTKTTDCVYEATTDEVPSRQPKRPPVAWICSARQTERSCGQFSSCRLQQGKSIISRQL